MTKQTERANAAMARYARGGDARDFGELYQLLYPRLFRHCRALCGSNDAQDLVQEVLLKMHAARSRFVADARGGVFAWTFAIARRTHYDRMRYCRRRPETIIDPNHFDDVAAKGGHPEHILAERALLDRLDYTLSSLSINARTAFVMVRIEGASCAAASSALGVSINTLKQRVHRASEELKSSVTGDLCHPYARAS